MTYLKSLAAKAIERVCFGIGYAAVMVPWAVGLWTIACWWWAP